MPQRNVYRIVSPALPWLFAGMVAALPCCLWPRDTRAQADEAKAPAQAQAAAPDARSDDRAAIRGALESLLKAFVARDPKALAAHWTAEGEYRPVAGAAVRGRDAIEKHFAGFFAGTPEVKADVKPESHRFLSSGTAVEEGSVSVRRGPAEPAIRAKYSALLVREDGQWRLAQLSESPEEGASIDEIAWLVGEWKSIPGQGAEIRTTYSWSASKKFLQSQFTLKEKAISLTGNQVIGVDPATGELHSWTFEADGGVGEADWRRDGDHWVLDAAGTLTDGRTIAETNILRRVNDDTFTWQSINRSLEDSDLADLAPVKVTRVKPGQ
jgi:uncharacterized protein (TIGR02246 family)